MNDKDIELFAKSFVNGMQGLNTTQVSREPIQLNSSEVVDEEMGQFGSTDLELNLIIELKLFNKEINSIRASDKVFSNEYKAEEKRQAQIVKKLNKIIKK